VAGVENGDCDYIVVAICRYQMRLQPEDGGLGKATRDQMLKGQE
jgi:hypothetical protein